MSVPAPDLSWDVERYVLKHGEAYRDVIDKALSRVALLPRFNPVTFPFDRYISAVVFDHMIGR